MRLLMATVALAVHLGAGATAADVWQQSPAILITVQGRVVSGSAPVAGADVVVVRDGTPVRVVTDEEGRFTLRVRVASGEVPIRARRKQGATAAHTIRVTPDDAGRTFIVTLDLRQAEIEAQQARRVEMARREQEARRAERERRDSDAKAAPPPRPSDRPATTPPAATPPAANPPPPPPPPPSDRPPTPTSGAEPDAPTDVVTVPVYYATDRNRSSTTPLSYDGTRNADGQLHLGRFDVSVPKDHRLGQVERPTWRTLWREDPGIHFVITARTELPYERFYGDIRAHVERSPRREALVFVHGYNVTFEDAVYRTAQITYDLEFAGAPILYSWPSEGRLASYPVDLNNNEWTTDHLRWFLQDVAERSGAQVIHVIAHSMGNRALMNAMSALVRERPDMRQRFAEVMLTAPDIDADVFVRLAAGVARAARRVTLYSSANDTALAASRTYQGYRRAGDSSQGVVTCAGVDTIDVSALKTDFLGHSYVGDHRSVVSDISEMLRNGSPPDRRFGLRPVGEPPKRYWLFRP